MLHIISEPMQQGRNTAFSGNIIHIHLCSVEFFFFIGVVGWFFFPPLPRGTHLSEAAFKLVKAYRCGFLFLQLYHSDLFLFDCFYLVSILFHFMGCFLVQFLLVLLVFFGGCLGFLFLVFFKSRYFGVSEQHMQTSS